MFKFWHLNFAKSYLKCFQIKLVCHIIVLWSYYEELNLFNITRDLLMKNKSFLFITHIYIVCEYMQTRIILKYKTINKYFFIL